MIVEQRTYGLKPGTVARYLAAYEAEGLAIQQPILGHLIGYFSTEIGPLNQIVHMWGYECLDERTRRRALLAADPRWAPFIGKLSDVLLTQETKILLPAPFSPIR